MEKISIDFVYEFAKDLKKLLEGIVFESNYSVFQRKEIIIERILKNSSNLTENLYEKYKNILDLKIRKTNDKCNFEFINSSYEIILIPEDLFKSFNYSEIKENFEIILILMRNINFSLKDFSFSLTQSINYSNDKANSLNSNTLEKIRFFMSFINQFPDYVTETPLPLETKTQSYKALYSKWGRSKTYYSVFKRYLEKDEGFFKNHLWINPIPNYPAWNFNMYFCSKESMDQISNFTEIPLYPLQVLEKINGDFNSILFLMSDHIVNDQASMYKNFMIEKFSIINNFNVFKRKENQYRGIKLELLSTFESFSEFIDKYNKSREQTKLENTTYEFSFDFKNKQVLNKSYMQIKSEDTIKLFNNKYKVKNNFNSLYSTLKPTHFNPYRIFFKNRYSFPDFNTRENFLLIIDKKKNVIFEKLIEFFKIWTYQSLVYELRKHIVIYGFLPSKINYNTELAFIYEILDNLRTKYEFLINNKNFKQSTLSLYTLPSSNQFLETKNGWNLNKYNLFMNIKEKEEIITNQLNEDSQN